jgi:Uma2 family endonuclease
MVSLLERPPRTTMEVFKMLPEGTRCELINGIIYMSPAPSLNHQDAVTHIGSQIYSYVKKRKLGKAYVSPIDVYLGDRANAFQPDFVFVSNQNLSILKEDGIYGAPDLVIEILSPGTKGLDLGKKKKVYEKAGVKEYWVIDTETKLCTGFQLVDKKFDEFKKEKNKLASSLLKQTFKL